MDGVEFVFPADSIFTGLGRGNHTFTVIDDNGCDQPFTFNVQSPGLVIADITTTETTCSGLGEDGTITVNITTGQSPFFYSLNGSDFTQAPGPTFVLTDLAQGTYELILKSQTPDDGCPNAFVVQVTGPSLIGFESEKEDVECFGESTGLIRLNNLIGGVGTGVSLNVRLEGPINTTLTNVGTTAEFRDLPAGSYTITLEQLGGCGDIRTVVENINQPEQLTATLGEATTSLPDIDQPNGTFELLNVRGGTPPYFLQYTGLEFLNQDIDTEFAEIGFSPTTLQFDTTLVNLRPGLYEFVIEDNNGCQFTNQFRVPVDTAIFIPNVFTPNNDNFNETFFIRNLPSSDSKLMVTNRWGRTVYESNNYQNDWDGSVLPEGLYFYRLELGDGRSFAGWVEIWRGKVRRN